MPDLGYWPALGDSEKVQLPLFLTQLGTSRLARGRGAAAGAGRSGGPALAHRPGLAGALGREAGGSWVAGRVGRPGSQDGNLAHIHSCP